MKAAISGVMGATALFGPAWATEPPSDDGIYLRAGAGASFVRDWSQDYAYNPALSFVSPPPTGQSLDNGTGFLIDAAIGFDYADGIRTELEYRYVESSIVSRTISEAGGPVVEFAPNDIQAQFVVPNFYFDFYNRTFLTPFIGGGVGGAFIKNENGRADSALVFQGRAGVSAVMSAGFSLDLEYLYARTKKLTFGPNPAAFTAGGSFETAITGERYEASSVLLTLRKLF